MASISGIYPNIEQNMENLRAIQASFDPKQKSSGGHLYAKVDLKTQTITGEKSFWSRSALKDITKFILQRLKDTSTSLEETIELKRTFSLITDSIDDKNRGLYWLSSNRKIVKEARKILEGDSITKKLDREIVNIATNKANDPKELLRIDRELSIAKSEILTNLYLNHFSAELKDLELASPRNENEIAQRRKDVSKLEKRTRLIDYVINRYKPSTALSIINKLRADWSEETEKKFTKVIEKYVIEIRTYGRDNPSPSIVENRNGIIEHLIQEKIPSIEKYIKLQKTLESWKSSDLEPDLRKFATEIYDIDSNSPSSSIAEKRSEIIEGLMQEKTSLVEKRKNLEETSDYWKSIDNMKASGNFDKHLEDKISSQEKTIKSLTIKFGKIERRMGEIKQIYQTIKKNVGLIKKYTAPENQIKKLVLEFKSLTLQLQGVGVAIKKYKADLNSNETLLKKQQKNIGSIKNNLSKELKEFYTKNYNMSGYPLKKSFDNAMHNENLTPKETLLILQKLVKEEEIDILAQKLIDTNISRAHGVDPTKSLDILKAGIIRILKQTDKTLIVKKEECKNLITEFNETFFVVKELNIKESMVYLLNHSRVYEKAKTTRNQEASEQLEILKQDLLDISRSEEYSSTDKLDKMRSRVQISDQKWGLPENIRLES